MQVRVAQNDIVIMKESYKNINKIMLVVNIIKQDYPNLQPINVYK